MTDDIIIYLHNKFITLKKIERAQCCSSKNGKELCNNFI